MKTTFAVPALLAFFAAEGVALAEPTAEEIAQLALDNNMFSTANARATLDLEIVKDGVVVRTRRITTMSKRAEGLVKTFVESEISREHFGSASEFIRQLIRKAQRERAREELARTTQMRDE